MERLLDYYISESCCRGSYRDTALKTAPFVALSIFGGPIAPAVGTVGFVASNLLPEYSNRREVTHLQLHFADGMVVAAALTFLASPVSARSVATLIGQAGTWGIVSIYLSRKLFPAGGGGPGGHRLGRE